MAFAPSDRCSCHMIVCRERAIINGRIQTVQKLHRYLRLHFNQGVTIYIVMELIRFAHPQAILWITLLPENDILIIMILFS